MRGLVSPRARGYTASERDTCSEQQLHIERDRQKEKESGSGRGPLESDSERDVYAEIQQEAHTQYLEQMVQMCRCYFLVHLHESSRRAVFSNYKIMASMSGVTILVLLAFMFFYYLVCTCLPMTSNSPGVVETR